ncbi:MAG TPA: N-acetyltransferase [Flavobacteriales bacterium]|nr:N-acetyltransferase [Flavobacteriales bacterium]
MELIKEDVKLRRLKLEDQTAATALANNKNVSKNLRDRMPSPYTLQDAIEWIEFCKDQSPIYNFAIEYEGGYVGTISLDREEDVYRHTAEIGYWIGEPHWGKGIVAKAVTLITDYGFGHLNLTRIHTGIYEYNEASMRVLEKCGYKFEGIFEKNVYKDGAFYNEHRYSKIK